MLWEGGGGPATLPQGSHTRCPAYQVFTLQLLTGAHLQRRSSNNNNFVVVGGGGEGSPRHEELH